MDPCICSRCVFLRSTTCTCGCQGRSLDVAGLCLSVGSQDFAFIFMSSCAPLRFACSHHELYKVELLIESKDCEFVQLSNLRCSGVCCACLRVVFAVSPCMFGLCCNLHVSPHDLRIRMFAPRVIQDRWKVKNVNSSNYRFFDAVVSVAHVFVSFCCFALHVRARLQFAFALFAMLSVHAFHATECSHSRISHVFFLRDSDQQPSVCIRDCFHCVQFALFALLSIVRLPVAVVSITHSVRCRPYFSCCVFLLCLFPSVGGHWCDLLQWPTKTGKLVRVNVPTCCDRYDGF